MTDDRLYMKITLEFFEHPKIEHLSPRAIVDYLKAIGWSRRMLTDGFIPEQAVRRRFTVATLRELMTNHPERPSIIQVEGGYLLRDFAEHQGTREEVEAKRLIRQKPDAVEG